MATVNFSVPDEVRAAFSRCFAGENKSAVIARLMMDAVAERERAMRRKAVVAALLELRERAPDASGARVRAARRRGRP